MEEEGRGELAVTPGGGGDQLIRPMPSSYRLAIFISIAPSPILREPGENHRGRGTASRKFTWGQEPGR